MAQQSLGQILTKRGWQTKDNSWKHPKRPNEEIIVSPNSWVHVKADIKAKHDKAEIAQGISDAELESHLSNIEGGL